MKNKEDEKIRNMMKKMNLILLLAAMEEEIKPKVISTIKFVVQRLFKIN